MLQKIAVMIIALSAAALTLCGCSKNSAAGTYIVTNKIVAGRQAESIEPARLTLQTDSSFYYEDNLRRINGNYSIQGQRIALTADGEEIIGEFYHDNANMVLSHSETILVLQKQAD